jgi:hypothetical protein
MTLRRSLKLAFVTVSHLAAEALPAGKKAPLRCAITSRNAGKRAHRRSTAIHNIVRRLCPGWRIPHLEEVR